ncbi:MAG: hypothetical protein L6Q97_18185, partial [Thermoanaerobaculia bacterium]|nr:hypothetical protein [Thermoanaerobaculia bacterium]
RNRKNGRFCFFVIIALCRFCEKMGVAFVALFQDTRTAVYPDATVRFFSKKPILAETAESPYFSPSLNTI